MRKIGLLCVERASAFPHFFLRSLKAVCAEGSSPRLEIYFYLRSKRNWITFYSGEWNGKRIFRLCASHPQCLSNELCIVTHLSYFKGPFKGADGGILSLGEMRLAASKTSGWQSTMGLNRSQHNPLRRARLKIYLADLFLRCGIYNSIFQPHSIRLVLPCANILSGVAQCMKRAKNPIKM